MTWITVAATGDYAEFTYIVVDTTATEYIVRADIDGNDAAMSTGEQDVDWEYVYIPFDEATRT